MFGVSSSGLPVLRDNVKVAVFTAGTRKSYNHAAQAVIMELGSSDGWNPGFDSAFSIVPNEWKGDNLQVVLVKSVLTLNKMVVSVWAKEPSGKGNVYREYQ